MVDRSKAVVSRAALERVLARAAELQNASGEDAERPDTLTEAQIEELGKEVGLSPQHVRQALAEERARIQPVAVSGSGIGYQLFGVDRVGAQRVVRGKPERLLAALDRWMQREEGLKVLRQRPDFIIWEPSRGIFESVRRVFGSGDFALVRSNEVSGTVVPVDDEFTLVRLEAAFSSLRSEMGSRTIMGTVFGAAGTGVALLLGVMAPVAVAPVVLLSAGSYYSARRTQQHAVHRAMLSLEQALDRLERTDSGQPSLLRLIESALPPTR
jgi:hypothetical protein